MGMFLNTVVSRVMEHIVLASHSAAHLLQNSRHGLVLHSWHSYSLLAGILSPCFNPGWKTGALFLLWWKALRLSRVNTSAMQCHAFSVVTPSIWNSLSIEIRLPPKSNSYLL